VSSILSPVEPAIVGSASDRPVETLMFTSSIAMAGTSLTSVESLESKVKSKKRQSSVPDSSRKCKNCLSKLCYIERMRKDNSACPKCERCKNEIHEMGCADGFEDSQIFTSYLNAREAEAERIKEVRRESRIKRKKTKMDEEEEEAEERREIKGKGRAK
jgi:hypothetical protein